MEWGLPARVASAVPVGSVTAFVLPQSTTQGPLLRRRLKYFTRKKRGSHLQNDEIGGSAPRKLAPWAEVFQSAGAWVEVGHVANHGGNPGGQGSTPKPDPGVARRQPTRAAALGQGGFTPKRVLKRSPASSFLDSAVAREELGPAAG